MSNTDEFRARYVAALRTYLDTRDEDSLAVGHELGRIALQERISVLDIVEHHFGLVTESGRTAAVDGAGALEFLLQTLAPLDAATRGFLDGTRRYAEQRARAEDLADRDKFRTALVNALQEGFFVADHEATVIEMNHALVEIVGYPAEGLPYRWPHPWLLDKETALQQRSVVRDSGGSHYETPIRHRDGHLVWVLVTINAVRGSGKAPDGPDMYVGTVRDVTAERAFAARESAVLRLATAVAVVKSVSELLSITLDECRAALDVRRVLVVEWPNGEGEPNVQAAGRPAQSWRQLDPWLRQTFQQARQQLPLTAKPIERPDRPGKAQGLVAVLSGSADLALWLELSSPRWVSAEDRLLVTVLIGHLSLAMQHVRQFETARETSLTLQRAMLPPIQPPPGFAVRYEPAVPPLEIGGDWYDVLPVGEHRIGIVVGDCVGRGLPAAAVMGQLRSSARALLINGAQPALLLEQLDLAASLIPNAYCTTVFVAILDTGSGIMEYSNAGHMPAVIVGPGPGTTTMLADAASVPLAVRRDTPRPQGLRALPAGSTLMVFTDGLVERKHESIDVGIARAAEVLAQHAALPPDAVGEVVLRELAPAPGFDDDVAMVIYRHRQPPFRFETNSSADQLAGVRRRLGEWLEGAGVPESLGADIVLVASEACTNCVEHAYRGRADGTILVESEAVDREIRLRVVDSGSWKQPAAHPGNSGRGLLLMRAISDSMEVHGTADGTTVEANFRLPAPAAAQGH